VIARPKMKRKATPTATAIPALAPIDNESELNGVAVELGLESWLTAAAVAEVIVVEDDVDVGEVEVVEVELVVMAEPAVEE
jgi:UbiD family decarboxylase